MNIFQKVIPMKVNQKTVKISGLHEQYFWNEQLFQFWK